MICKGNIAYKAINLAINAFTVIQLYSTMPKETLLTQEERFVIDALSREEQSPQKISERIKRTANAVKRNPGNPYEHENRLSRKENKKAKQTAVLLSQKHQKRANQQLIIASLCIYPLLNVDCIRFLLVKTI